MGFRPPRVVGEYQGTNELRAERGRQGFSGSISGFEGERRVFFIRHAASQLQD
jgi:hypothetical protein